MRYMSAGKCRTGQRGRSSNRSAGEAGAAYGLIHSKLQASYRSAGEAGAAMGAAATVESSTSRVSKVTKPQVACVHLRCQYLRAICTFVLAKQANFLGSRKKIS